jgi:hypothetical protein
MYIAGAPVGRAVFRPRGRVRGAATSHSPAGRPHGRPYGAAAEGAGGQGGGRRRRQGSGVRSGDLAVRVHGVGATTYDEISWWGQGRRRDGAGGGGGGGGSEGDLGGLPHSGGGVDAARGWALEEGVVDNGPQLLGHHRPCAISLSVADAYGGEGARWALSTLHRQGRNPACNRPEMAPWCHIYDAGCLPLLINQSCPAARLTRWAATVRTWSAFLPAWYKRVGIRCTHLPRAGQGCLC